MVCRVEVIVFHQASLVARVFMVRLKVKELFI
jgi:hypothetical protein